MKCRRKTKGICPDIDKHLELELKILQIAPRFAKKRRAKNNLIIHTTQLNCIKIFNRPVSYDFAAAAVAFLSYNKFHFASNGSQKLRRRLEQYIDC